MAKKKKYEKVTEIVNFDRDGNIVTQKLTGNTGGYTRETTPALVGASQELKKVEPTVKVAQTNFKNAENDLNLAQSRYETALANELKKTGKDYRTKFDDFTKNKISYQTKEQDKENATPKIEKIPIQEANKNLQNELADVQDKFDKWKIANYEKNLAKAQSKPVSVWDKTGGNVTRALVDMVSPLTQGEAYEMKDEKGNKTYLPSYNELRQQEVQSSYGDNLIGKAAKFSGDVLYGGTKIAGATALDAVTGGLGGKALYWTDMASDNYKNVKNQGYSDKQALANTAIATGTEFLTEKLLGGFAGKLTGGEASAVENAVSKAVSKVVSNPQAAKVIGGMTSEGLEEFTQEYIGALNDKITLGKDTNLEDLVKDSLYSGLVGAGTAGLIQGGEVSMNTTKQSFNNQKASLQTPITQDSINTQQKVETKPTIEENNQIKAQQLNQIEQDVKTGTITPEQGQIALQQVQTRVDPQTTETKPVAKLTQQEQQELDTLKDLPFELDEQQERRMDELLLKQNKDLEKNMSPVRNLSDVRDFNEVGSKKVNAYQYDNPEVKPYFQEVAKDMLYDLDNSTKGERYMTEDGQFKGIKRNVPNDIAELLDGENGVKYSYKEIEDGLNAIIKDNGAENKAVAKRLEFYIDQRLRNGYMDSIAGKIPANSEYIETLRNKNVGENPNIPAEMEKEEALKFTAKDINGKDVKLNKNNDVYEKEIPKPKDNKSIIPKETLEKQLLKLNDGTKISNFYTNITDSSKFITEDNAQKLSQEEIWKYAPQTNKETMKNAMAEIGETQKSVDNAYADFLSKTQNFTPEDVAKGWIFLKRFQDAGNYDAMVQVAKKMRNIGTKSGQTVQMFNLQSRLTPEGMVKYAQSELMEAEQAYNKGKTKEQIEKHAKDFELTGDEVEYIKNQMEKIQNMEDGREKNIEMAKINKMLSDKLPHQKGDSIKAWMRISMLFNPKTQVRNIVGNALITPVNALADVSASLVDKAISRKTDVRTIGAPSLGGLATYGKGFVQGGKEAIQDYRMGINTKDVDMSRFDITQGKPFVENHEGLTSVLNPFSKVGNKANDILDLVMSGGDRVFYQGAFESSLKNQMKLNNVDVPTQDMIDIATQEALSRTWNDNNGYTQFVLNTRRGLNKLNVGGYGIGDVLIPFAKTPANLTKAIVDYSPVGLASSIFKTKGIKNAIETGQITPQMQHEFAQNIGKGVAGTMLYLLAYGLAKNGVASGSKDDDKDVANFIKNTMGIQPYSIKIGDKSFTYDWAQPLAAPLAIVTDAYKNLSNKSDEDATTRIFNTILDVSNTGLNVLMQQSFLSGISEVLNDNEGVVNGIMNQVLSLPARGIPTLFKQINDMVDTTQRTAYENNRPLTTAKQNAMAKTPYSKKLAPSVDTLGREIPKYGGDKNKITYAIKSFLSPANESNKRTTKTAEEIYSLYEATGDKTIMPRVAPYYVQNKEIGRVDLSSKDRAKYQKTSGKIVDEALNDLINDNRYQNLNDDQKVQVISKIVGYADAKAKEQITGKISSYYSGADKKINNGMGIADYYLDRIK